MELRKIPDEQRMDFLPSKFAGFLHFERYVYIFADRMVPEYAKSNGYWEFYEAPNGAAFMQFDTHAETVTVNAPSHAIEMTPRAASITCCLYALGALAEHDSEKISSNAAEMYHLLRDAVGDLPQDERAAVLAAID